MLRPSGNVGARHAAPQRKRRGTACYAPTPGNDRAAAAETSGDGMLRPSGNVGARHAVPRPRAMIALPQRKRRGTACYAPTPGNDRAAAVETSGHGMPCPDPGQ
jgi:hypothetical protein